MLALMINSSAEDSQLLLNYWNCADEFKLKSDVHLENVRSVMKEIKVRDDLRFKTSCEITSNYKPALELSFYL